MAGTVDDLLFVVALGGTGLLELLTKVEPGLIPALLATSIDGAGGPLSQPRWARCARMACSNAVALSLRYFLPRAVDLCLSGGE